MRITDSDCAEFAQTIRKKRELIYRTRFCEKWGYEYSDMPTDEMVEFDRGAEADNAEYQEWVAVQDSQEMELEGTR